MTISSLYKSKSLALLHARLYLLQITLSRLKIRRGVFASLIGDVKRNLLTFVQAAHACALDGAHVYEHIRATIIRLDKTKAFLSVEPFNCTLSHIGLLVETHYFSCMKHRAATIAAQLIRK